MCLHVRTSTNTHKKKLYGNFHIRWVPWDKINNNFSLHFLLMCWKLLILSSLSMIDKRFTCEISIMHYFHMTWIWLIHVCRYIFYRRYKIFIFTNSHCIKLCVYISSLNMHESKWVYSRNIFHITLFLWRRKTSLF